MQRVPGRTVPMIPRFAPLLPFLLAPALAAQAAPGDLLVSSRFTDQILRYDANTGSFLGVFAAGGGLVNPVGLTFGPDGNLYVASGETDEVLRYDGLTGAFLGVFASGGGLDGPRQINFGPDGQLYVASGSTNQILRYDGTTGAPFGPFASGGNLSGPNGFTFGADRDLYVASVLNDRVKRYDGATGVFLGNFVGPLRINGPHDVAFGPDGRFYVTSAFTTRIQAFDGASGAFLETLLNDPALSFPLGMSWDDRGRLYVSNQGGNEVRRYDAVTGAFLGAFVLPGAGGLQGPLYHTFVPDRAGLSIAPLWPGYAGESNILAVQGARPGTRILFLTGPAPSSVTIPSCAQPLTLLLPPALLGIRISDESGRAYLAGHVPAPIALHPFQIQALSLAECAASPVVSTSIARRLRRSGPP